MTKEEREEYVAYRFDFDEASVAPLFEQVEDFIEAVEREAKKIQ